MLGLRPSTDSGSGHRQGVLARYALYSASPPQRFKPERSKRGTPLTFVSSRVTSAGDAAAAQACGAESEAAANRKTPHQSAISPA